jgi:hypothetical protein
MSRTIRISMGWCEICKFSLSTTQLSVVVAIRIIIASSVGIPASSLCINRRLYKIASAQAMSFGRAEVPFPVGSKTLTLILYFAESSRNNNRHSHMCPFSFGRCSFTYDRLALSHGFVLNENRKTQIISFKDIDSIFTKTSGATPHYITPSSDTSSLACGQSSSA